VQLCDRRFGTDSRVLALSILSNLCEFLLVES
jgi:hypothetical protein